MEWLGLLRGLEGWYAMSSSSSRETGYEGMVTFCSPMTICPWVMSWRACLMVLARPL